MKKTITTLIFALSLSIQGIFAQVPVTFHFQGSLKDNDGLPVDDTKYIEFRMYNTPTGGTPLWSEGPIPVEIKNGIFSVELGTANPFQEGLFDNTPLYITFALAAGEMEPRQKLLSVPFALKAASSDEDWEMVGNYVINLADSIGIGTSNPQTKFEVNAIMRLTPAGMDALCDPDLEGSLYYDGNLKEYCFCDGTYWQQLDGGGLCECVDLDGDGADICDSDHPYDTDGLDADCDDGDNTIYPGNTEYCDGIDNDCDSATPDGSGEPNFGLACDGPDSDLCEEGTNICMAGVMVCSDFTGDNEELCDGLDNDCNPSTPDGTGDPLYGSPCDGPDADLCEEGIFDNCIDGTFTCSDNTGDNEEICNGIDDDCDGEYDEGPVCEAPNTNGICTGAGGCQFECIPPYLDCNGNMEDGCESLGLTFYLDNDNDGYGDPYEQIQDCVAPPGYVDNGDDCDDNDPNEFPGQMWYPDCDGDGYFSSVGMVSCEIPASSPCSGGLPPIGGYSNAPGTDCDDDDPNEFPGQMWYPDCDGDGIFSSVGVASCEVPTSSSCNGGLPPIGGYSNNAGSDCDDEDPNNYPGNAEICDGFDNDCNPSTWAVGEIDQDEDGYMECENDCDDTDPDINPGMTEICNNGIDDNCNGLTDCFPGFEDPDCGCGMGCWDNDGDGYPDEACGGTDCDDNNPDVHPDALEIPDDGIDQDCNGMDAIACVLDSDMDGYGTDQGTMVIAGDGSCDVAQGESNSADDCNDNNPAINPGAIDDPGNDLDENCSGTVVCFHDNDNDAYGSSTSQESTYVANGGVAIVTNACNSSSSDSWDDANDDCNDANANVNPGATEICDNTIDDDCDFLIDEADPDCEGFLDDDNDGLINSLDPDPIDPDSDNDGLCDGNLDVIGICIGGEDLDADGIIDAGETDPLDADTDDDGLSDGEEDINGSGSMDANNETNALVADTDGDGLMDGLELGRTSGISSGVSIGGVPYAGSSGFIGDQDSSTTTDPRLMDSDQDGFFDMDEDINGNGALDPGETNPIDLDTDDDGIRDENEALYSLYPYNSDSDGDGLQDGTELGKYNFISGGFTSMFSIPIRGTNSFFIADGDAGATTTNPNNPDTDNDGLCDGNATLGGICMSGEDIDQDGVVDSSETDPADNDTDNDGSVDGADCAPLNGSVFPGQTEICDNGIDDDCDGLTDEDDPDCQ
ncbi:MAG: hypothetical protein KQI35_01270 [Bacteroidetes bacterium]|nr:hypothetical protein [Bacteroidota bacterium]